MHVKADMNERMCAKVCKSVQKCVTACKSESMCDFTCVNVCMMQRLAAWLPQVAFNEFHGRSRSKQTSKMYKYI